MVNCRCAFRTGPLWHPTIEILQDDRAARNAVLQNYRWATNGFGSVAAVNNDYILPQPCALPFRLFCLPILSFRPCWFFVFLLYLSRSGPHPLSLALTLSLSLYVPLHFPFFLALSLTLTHSHSLSLTLSLSLSLSHTHTGGIIRGWDGANRAQDTTLTHSLGSS